MINKDRLIENFLMLTALDGVSRNERFAMDEIKRQLEQMGVVCFEDSAGEKFEGNCGNVIARIPGTIPGEPFFFSAHVDTIQPSNGSPHIKDGVFYSDGNTILGADDRAGVAAMIEAVQTAKEQNTRHTGIELLFLVGEEVGLFGSKFIDYNRIESKNGFVLDSSADLGKIVSRAPTHLSCKIEIKGQAAHAAIAPEQGVHAIKIASEAIHNTELGRVSGNTTVSIGTINGGTKSNIIPDRVEIDGEIRCLDDSEIPVYKAKLERNFTEAANKHGGKFEIKWEQEYSGFMIHESANLVTWICEAMKNTGIEPELIKFIGGSDANNFNQKGIPTVNLGIGYKKNHSKDEYMSVDDLVGITKAAYEVIKLSGEYSK